MNYGLYLSASGALTASYRQDVLANNLANVHTTAFQPDIPTITQRPAESIEDPAGYGVSKRMLDRLGGGVLAGPQLVSRGVGPLEQTGNPLDAALPEPNTYFQVSTTDPATGQAVTRLTRDGRFGISPTGNLITRSGLPVLDPTGEPITLAPDSPARIDTTGNLWQNGAPVAQLAVVAVSPDTPLAKRGKGQLEPPVGVTPVPLPQPRVESGMIEGSGVDPIRTLMQITDATRAATANAQMIKYHDQMMNGAVNTLGRVA